MPFRDNDEATRARAEALAEKVEELEKERDELLEEKKAHFEHPDANADDPQKQADSASAETPEQPTSPANADAPPIAAPTFFAKYGFGLVILAVVVIVTIAVGMDKKAHRSGPPSPSASAAASAAKERQARADAMTKEWNALIVIESCLRAAELASSAIREIAPREMQSKTPEENINTQIYSVVANCTHERETLLAMPTLTQDAKDALRRWSTTEAPVHSIALKLALYYKGGDFRDDDFKSAPAQWAALLSAMDERAQTFSDVRALALPILRARIRERQSASPLEGGAHSDLWWRVELGLAIWDIDEIAFRESGISAGKKPDFVKARLATHEAVAAFDERVKSAPLTVRRDIRRYDVIAMTRPDAGAAHADAGAGTSFEDSMLHMFMSGTNDPMSELRDRM